MRKRFKSKKRSCPMCKPNKRGFSKRWKSKDEALLKEFEGTTWWIASENND